MASNRYTTYGVIAMVIAFAFAFAFAFAVSAQTADYNNAQMRSSSSPYLRQHATSPIDWLPYSESGLAEARLANRLIFLSIGYATCHWCHVMTRESFHDPAVAKVLNNFYISIKMDRDQHPEADSYYNQLLELAGGTSGWPLNGILLPDGTPVWLGNYLTTDRLITLLSAFADHYDRRSDDLKTQANIYRGVISILGDNRSAKSSTHSIETSQEARDQLLAKQDLIYGGVQGDRKFITTENIDLLWSAFDETADLRFKAAALKELDGMLNGQVYDPLFGGFFRYASARDWGTPHFEKLLETQLDAIQIFSEAYERTDIIRYKIVAEDTVSFIESQLQLEGTPAFVTGINSEYLEQDGARYLLSDDQFRAIKDAFPNVRGAKYGQGWLTSLVGDGFLELDGLRKIYRDIVPDFTDPPLRDEKVMIAANARMVQILKAHASRTNNERAEQMSAALIKFLCINGRADEGTVLRQIGLGATLPASAAEILALVQASRLMAVPASCEWLPRQPDSTTWKVHNPRNEY